MKLDPNEVHEVGGKRRRPLITPAADITQRIEAIAYVCHEANRAYCHTIGDDSQQPWAAAPEWQRESARVGVRGILDGSITQPSDSHESWSKQKIAEGWVWGEVKDPEAKTHHCLVPYDELPPEQRQKDVIFLNTVRAMVSK